jgi:hypothetical protein
VVGVALDPAVGESSLTQLLAVFNTKTHCVYRLQVRQALLPALAKAWAIQEAAKARGRPVTS